MDDKANVVLPLEVLRRANLEILATKVKFDKIYVAPGRELFEVVVADRNAEGPPEVVVLWLRKPPVQIVRQQDVAFFQIPSDRFPDNLVEPVRLEAVARPLISIMPRSIT